MNKDFWIRILKAGIFLMLILLFIFGIFKITSPFDKKDRECIENTEVKQVIIKESDLQLECEEKGGHLIVIWSNYDKEYSYSCEFPRRDTIYDFDKSIK